MEGFRDAWRARQGLLDEAYAEPVRFFPMARPANGRPGPDPLRPVRELRGILDIPSDESIVRFPEADRTLSKLSGAAPRVDFDQALFTSSSDEPRQGDRFEAINRPGTPLFEVLSVDRDASPRLICRLALMEGST